MDTVYGSDTAISAMADLGIDVVAFNPGASFRGLHESMVHAARQRPVLCLSEGVAVAAAHGYAKVTGRAMGVFLHNLVGLQAGSMALFNAWVDQAPMLVIGGSGPADRTRRRPWIDWIHSASPQGAVVRDWVKWDDEPASVPALLDSLDRGHHLAMSAPQGPVYISFDALLQEAPVDGETGLRRVGPRGPATFTAPSADLEQVADELVTAHQPVILADLAGRSSVAYDAIQELSELLVAPVVDLGGRHNFPNTHPLDGTPRRRELLGTADLALLLDVRDAGWALCDVDPADRTSRPLLPAGAQVIALGLGPMLTGGFLEPHGDLPHEQRQLLADTAVALPTLVDLLRADPRTTGRSGGGPASIGEGPRPDRDAFRASGPIDDDLLAAASHRAVREGPWLLANGSLRGAVRRHWRLDRWNAHLGGSGGAGLGYGVGATIGAALGVEDDRLVVSLQADGDLLYTASGLWTAAHERLPMLIIVVNNRCYGQDRMHQTIMSQTRQRPIEHASVGIDLDDPDIDFVQLAAAQGVEAAGPVVDAADLDVVLERAARTVRDEARPMLVDVRVDR